MKLVSIIIPYFKKKQHIHKSVNSVLRQSYKNFELIIVYDDEKKEDLKYLEKIQKLDKRIKLIINKKNFGAGISRNIGIKYSKGAFIAFLDADDIWHQSKLKIQLEYMLKNNLNITHTSYKILSEGKFIDNRTARTIDDFNELLKSCDIGLSTVMLRKKIFNKKIKFPSIKTKEDFVLWLNLLKNGEKIFAINKNLVTWKKTSDSLSSSVTQKIIDAYRVYYLYMNFNFIKSVYYIFLLSINFIKKSYK
jgi:teichuronic acid biosynthesis glycosyltransferase TuaG